jgi:putative ABC transport system permease protein
VRAPLAGLRALRALRATWGGTGAAATGALALLVLGCVFVAMAGPRASLGLRNRALRHTLATVPAVASTVQASAQTNEFTQAPVAGGQPPLPAMTPQIMSAVRQQLAGDLAADGLPLAPQAEDWSSLNTPFGAVAGAGPGAQAQVGPKLQVVYRDNLGRYSRLVAGQYPASTPLRGQRIAVLVSQQTATRFGVHPGSRLRLGLPSGSVLTIEVSGVVAPLHKSSAFWLDNTVVEAPTLFISPPAPSYWQGAVIIGAGGLGTLQRAYAPVDLPMQWQYPLAFGQAGAGQAPQLLARLNGIGAHTPALSGKLAASAAAVSFTAPTVTQNLQSFLTTQNSVDGVLSLVFIGLTVIGAVVLMLSAQMVTARRAGEWAALRARGASLRQLATLALRDTALAVVPAALAGGALAVLLTPDESVPLAWWLAAVSALTALAGPPLAAVIRHRPVRQATVTYQTGALQPTGISNPGPRQGRGQGRWVGRRLVAEVAMIAAAIGGLVLLRFEGLSQAGGVNAFTSAAPVLVAIPAAIAVLRLYPLALRLVLRLSARRAGVTGFLAVARAGRAPATVLPVFALVLALTLAAFAGMVRAAVSHGEVTASWQATGADAVVNAEFGVGRLTPAAARALPAVPGVQRTTEVSIRPWQVNNAGSVSVIAVDPASYAALVATTPSAPFPAGKLAKRPASLPAGPAPVLVSRAAARVLGPGTALLQSPHGQVAVKIAGTLSTTPAQPVEGEGETGGGAFVIVADWALPAAERALPPNVMLIGGPGVNGADLTRVAHRLLPGSSVSLRSAYLASLASSPLPSAAYLGFAVGLAAAAGFSLAVLLLDLALGADARRMTLARLATMGLDTGQARRLTLLETLPAVLAAGLAGVVCALALVPLTAPVIDLSVFTGSAAPVPLRPDFAALGLPVAGLVVIAVLTLLLQIRVERYRGVATALRAGQ